MAVADAHGERRRTSAVAYVTKTLAALATVAVVVVVGGDALVNSKGSSNGASTGRAWVVSIGASLAAERAHVADSFSSTSSPVLALQVQTEHYGQVRADNYPWVKGRGVVEPMKTTLLQLEGMDSTAAASAALYTWSIGQYNNQTGEVNPQTMATVTSTGSQLKYVFGLPSTYGVSVSVVDAAGVTLAVHSTEVLCRYVKRELRSLTEDDRDAFLDAAVALWDLDIDTGREKYGDRFTTISEFVLLHAFKSTGDVECDQFHEGTGFMAHHFALTVAFESSLRAVNPAVTVPYWDFTIEGEAIDEAGGSPAMLGDVSPFFSDEWFGSTDENNHIQDSRWAHTAVIVMADLSNSSEKAKMVKDEKFMTNSYGIITAPWNNNADSELARSMSSVCGMEPTNKKIPTCSNHFSLLNETDLGEFMLLLPGVGHGPMHVNTGGVYGECEDSMADFYVKWADELALNVTIGPSNELMSDEEMVLVDDADMGDYTVYSKSELFQEKIHLEYFHMYRMLWRSQTCALDGQPLQLQCPDSCDFETPSDECTCTCAGMSGDDWDSDAWLNVQPCMYASNTTQVLMEAILSEDLRKDFVTQLCSTSVQEGQQLESASPLDILFWMIHPVLDRILTAKRLAGSVEGEVIEFNNYGQVTPFTNEVSYESGR